MSGEGILGVALLASMVVNAILVLGGGAILLRVLKAEKDARERERRDLAEIMRGVPLENDVQIVNPEGMTPPEEIDHDDLSYAFEQAEERG